MVPRLPRGVRGRRVHHKVPFLVGIWPKLEIIFNSPYPSDLFLEEGVPACRLQFVGRGCDGGARSPLWLPLVLQNLFHSAPRGYIACMRLKPPSWPGRTDEAVWRYGLA